MQLVPVLKCINVTYLSLNVTVYRTLFPEKKSSE
jgi:hypothetical protein